MIVAVSGPYSHDIAQALFGTRSSTNMQSATFSYSLVNSMILLYIKILFLLSLHIVTTDNKIDDNKRATCSSFRITNEIRERVSMIIVQLIRAHIFLSRAVPVELFSVFVLT